MSNLKNTFGIPQSLIDAAKQIHETSHLVGKQKKIDADKDGKITGNDFNILRKMKKEEKTPINEIGDTQAGKDKLIDYVKARQTQGWLPGADKKQSLAATRIGKKITPIPMLPISQSYEPDGEAILEYDFKANQQGAYPFSWNQLTPFFTMLRSLLDIVQKTPALRKLMKEETGFAGTDIEALISFLQTLGEEIELIEYRTKGAVGKKKQSAMSTSSSAPPKKSEDDEEEDQGPAYEPASGKDQEHIMTQLKGAMDDIKGGRHIDTSGGKKYVTKATASKIHSHLMGLKAPERAQSSSDLYNLKVTHPMTKHIQDDHREATQRGIKAPTEKKGRGRPKKAVD